MIARRYLVAGGSEPVRIAAWHGDLIRRGEYRTQREAYTEAEQYVADGLRGVAIQEQGTIVEIWPMCRTVVTSHTLPGGRYWPTHWCGRHDLRADGRCAEHSDEDRAAGSEPRQLDLLEVSR